MKILTWPSKQLLTPAEEDVLEFGEDLASFIAAMKTLVYKFGALGLAAPQLGCSKKIFVARVGNDKELDDKEMVTFVNPTVVDVDGPIIDTVEACLSLPGVKAHLRSRRGSIMVQAFDETGIPFQNEYRNTDAVILQHELEHLQGKTIMEGMGSVQKMMAVKRMAKVNKKLKTSAV